LANADRPERRGPLIILSGPSGAGKSTVIRQLIEEGGVPLRLSVSATTREPRPEEREGVDYHFLTRQQFEELKEQGAFLEWAKVHDHYYGTLRREVDEPRDRGVGVILDIDVQGAEQVRQQCPDAVSVFLTTSSPEVYAERLRRRGTETEASISCRLANARREEERKNEYDHVVVNDDLEQAVAGLREVVVGAF
jgi:guanylate kinase